MKYFFIVLIIFLGVGAKADFPQRFIDEQEGLSTTDVSTLSLELMNYSIVFVNLDDWFFATLNGFSDHADLLKTKLKHRNVYFASSKFFASYDQNAVSLNRQFRKIFETSGKPLIVIGNPQAGPDSLYAILKDPDLIESRIIDKVVLIQPAFGSKLADFSQQAGSIGNLGKFSTEKTKTLFSSAVASLKKTSASTLQLISERLFYIRSYINPLRQLVPFGITPFKSTFQILSYFGPNDGVSLTEEQMLKEIGNDLGVIEGNHWDLFATSPAARHAWGYRSAFVLALFGELLASEVK